jgi:hypothetical protein
MVLLVLAESVLLGPRGLSALVAALAIGPGAGLETARS